MQNKKYVSLFPYNVPSYWHNHAFDSKRNKGIEALIFKKLKSYLSTYHIEINTFDFDTSQEPNACVYFEVPYPWNISAWKGILKHPNKNVLLCNEQPFINPFNYWKIFHFFFRKIYTWNDDLVDNHKYFKVLLPKSSQGMNTKLCSFKKKKFLTIINKNTLPFFPFTLLPGFGRELYSERIKAIEFFERIIPSTFSLYGRGWNKPKKYNITEHIFGFRKYKTYKGEVDDKFSVLSQFKFSICFENLTDVKGYITEKIFDCMKAKCIPIYWGASDISDYIPKNCFIDYRDFGNFEKLLQYLESIDEKTYNAYTKNIEKLLADKKFIATWFEDGFAKFFLHSMLSGLI